MEALVNPCSICWVWLGMRNLFQNSKVSKSQGNVELFCLFVACSYTFMEVRLLSCILVRYGSACQNFSEITNCQ